MSFEPRLHIIHCPITTVRVACHLTLGSFIFDRVKVYKHEHCTRHCFVRSLRYIPVSRERITFTEKKKRRNCSPTLRYLNQFKYLARAILMYIERTIVHRNKKLQFYDGLMCSTVVTSLWKASYLHTLQSHW